MPASQVRGRSPCSCKVACPATVEAEDVVNRITFTQLPSRRGLPSWIESSGSWPLHPKGCRMSLSVQKACTPILGLRGCLLLVQIIGLFHREGRQREKVLSTLHGGTRMVHHPLPAMKELHATTTNMRSDVAPDGILDVVLPVPVGSEGSCVAETARAFWT